MQIWYTESKRCHERQYNGAINTLGAIDTIRIDLYMSSNYEYPVGHIEASVVMGEDMDMHDKLKRFLDEAAKLYGKMILDCKVEELK